MSWWTAIIGCRHHEPPYQEREEKTREMRYRCNRCHADLGPVVKRTPKERKQAQRTGAVKEPKAHTVTSNVEPMRKRA